MSKMKQIKISPNRFGFLKLTRFIGIIFGLMIVHVLTITANAQLEGTRPGAYNPKINYGNSRETGLTAEAKSYDAYLSRVLLFESRKILQIEEDGKECYRRATNAVESRKCSDQVKEDKSNLASEMKELRDGAYKEYRRRKDLINKYWDQRN